MKSRGEVTVTESTVKRQRFVIPTRYVIPIMGFFGYWLISANRLNLSLSIVAMVNATAVYGKRIETDGNATFPEDPTKDGEFIWSPKTQGVILGAFYWTLGVGCLIGGRMCEILGSKNVFGFGMLIYSLLTLITPVSARYHWYALIAVRALSGLVQGIVFPAFAPLVGKWIPVPERSLMMSSIYGGMHFGSFATISVSGYLCDSEFLGGWPSIYYIFGFISCVWCLLFMILIYETPSEHPWISDQELRFILDSTNTLSTKKPPSIPWKSICRSRPVWALVISAIAVRWAQYHFYTVHPTFMATILEFSIEKNGVLSSLPHLSICIMTLAAGSVSDVIRRRKYLSISVNHKCFVTVGMLGYVVCLLGVIVSGYDIMWNTVLLVVAMGFTGIAYVAEVVAPVDMSSHFSGTVLGMCGLISTCAGFIVPIIVGVLTEKEQTLSQWRIIFYISMAVVIACTLIFDIMGSAEKQPWDTSDDKTPKNKNSSQVVTIT